MRKLLLISLLLTVSTHSFAKEKDMDDEEEYKPCACEPAGYTSKDTTVLSMMGWGIGLFAGIAVLVSLLDNNPGSD